MKKHAGGRPRKITQHIARKIFLLAGYGLTDAQLADVFDISSDTIDKLKKDSQFDGTLKRIKEQSDLAVVGSLYKRAIGYEYDEVVYEKSKTGGLSMKVLKNAEKDGLEISGVGHTDAHIQRITKKHVLPDVTACIFWLKNRQRKEWREKVEDVAPAGDTHYHLTLVSPPPATAKEELTHNRVLELIL